PLLRAAPLRFRLPDAGETAPRGDPRGAPPRDRDGDPARRPRTELRLRLPRRTPQPVPPRRRRRPTLAADLHPRRVPRRPRERLGATEIRGERRRPRALPPQGGPGIFGGRGGTPQARRRVPDPGLRVLRP